MPAPLSAPRDVVGRVEAERATAVVRDKSPVSPGDVTKWQPVGYSRWQSTSQDAEDSMKDTQDTRINPPAFYRKSGPATLGQVLYQQRYGELNEGVMPPKTRRRQDQAVGEKSNQRRTLLCATTLHKPTAVRDPGYVSEKESPAEPKTRR